MVGTWRSEQGVGLLDDPGSTNAAVLMDFNDVNRQKKDATDDDLCSTPSSSPSPVRNVLSMCCRSDTVRLMLPCRCGETQTMSHIVDSRPLTKLDAGLWRLHPADDDAI